MRRDVAIPEPNPIDEFYKLKDRLILTDKERKNMRVYFWQKYLRRRTQIGN